MNNANDAISVPVADCSEVLTTAEAVEAMAPARVSLRDLFRPSVSKKKGSIKFSARNFVAQSYDAFEDHYEIMELLGEGGYGEVYICRHRESGAERAVKVMDVSSEDQAETVLAEFNVLRGLDHPNLLKVFQLYEDEEASKYYIVTDLYEGGELYDEIEQWGSFVEEDAATIMHQVLSCLNYCHSEGIMHRDIKPENILLVDETMNFADCKLIDFGLAAIFDDYEKDKFFDKVGSSYYMAPEILGSDGHGPKVDIWSCGVVSYILLCGAAPFDGDDDEDIIDAVMSGEFTFGDDPIWDAISAEAKDFVEYLLTYNPEDRPTAEAALKHPWLENTRSRSSREYHAQTPMAVASFLANLEIFRADGKLKQAVCAFIASQVLARGEKDEIDAAFRAIDSNCNGRLSKEELKNAFKEFAGKELTDNELNDIFERVNFSASGVGIEYSEFVVASMANLLDEDKLRCAFNVFDKEGTGFLTRASIKEVLANIYKDAEADLALQQIMSQVENRDGKISFEDFKHAMMDSGDISKTSDHHRTDIRKSTVGRRSIRRVSNFFLQDSYDDLGSALVPPAFTESKSLGFDDLVKRIKTTTNNIKPTKSFASIPHNNSLGYARNRVIRGVPLPNRTESRYKA